MSPRFNKITIIIATAIVALVVFIIYVLTVGSSSAAKIIFNVIPSDATIKLDGKQVNGQTIKTTAGHHTVVASANGYADDKRNITLKKGEVSTLYLIPAPISDAARAFLQNNPTLEALREKYAGFNSDLIQSTIDNNYPLIKDLPYETANISIHYGVSEKYPNDPTKFAIYIKSAPADRQVAIEWIKAQGFNPNNYEIVYQNP
jgi:hypothetical protein